jgi:hypothetical protein
VTDEEFGDLRDLASAELAAKQQRLRADYDIGTYPRWWFDQARAKLQFLDATDAVVVEADVIHIGSFSPASGTWCWAWANASVVPALRARALPIKELAEITQFDVFLEEGSFEVDEPMAWELTALAVKHLGALGCYRAPMSTGVYTFLALVQLQVDPPRSPSLG